MPFVYISCLILQLLTEYVSLSLKNIFTRSFTQIVLRVHEIKLKNEKSLLFFSLPFSKLYEVQYKPAVICAHYSVVYNMYSRVSNFLDFQFIINQLYQKRFFLKNSVLTCGNTNKTAWSYFLQKFWQLFKTNLIVLFPYLTMSLGIVGTFAKK